MPSTASFEKIKIETQKAWKLNWDAVSMDQILSIFGYERVKKQMEIFLRVLPKGEKILEGGCGLAPYLIQLRRLGFDVIGVDYNEEPLKKALSFDPSLPLKKADVTRLPFPDGHFGGYLSLGVIEHFVEGPEAALKEAARVLKRGGVLIVAVPLRHVLMKLGAPLRALKQNRFLRKLLGKPLTPRYWERYFGKDELKGILEENGFEVREIHPLDHSHAWVSFSDFFRDKTKYDEANRWGLRLGRLCEKYLPWSTAPQMTFVCRKTE